MDDDSVYCPEFHDLSPGERHAIEKYLEIETEFMAAENFYCNYTHLKIREFAVAIIARHSTRIGLGVYIPYLAMNYFDRYFSRNLLPDRDEDVFNQTRMLAICCLTIAAKLRIKCFSVNQFLEDMSINDISHQQILQMEIRILSGLQCRMLPVTPFCFLDYYYFYFKQFGGFNRRCINEIIVQSQGVPFFTQHKPSRIAFSSLLAATSELYRNKYEKLGELGEVEGCVNELIILCKRLKIEVESVPVVRRSEAMPICQRRSTVAIPHLALEPVSDLPQQRPRKTVDLEISEVVEETSGDDELSETESERQRRAAKGKAPMEEAFGDDLAVLEGILEEIRRLAKGGKVVVVAKEEEQEDAKAERVMNFYLQWPIETKPPDQPMDPRLLVDPSLLVSNPERGPGATSQKKPCFNICGFSFR